MDEKLIPYTGQISEMIYFPLVFSYLLDISACTILPQRCYLDCPIRRYPVIKLRGPCGVGHAFVLHWRPNAPQMVISLRKITIAEFTHLTDRQIDLSHYRNLSLMVDKSCKNNSNFIY